jgi:hypothetical protein
LRQVEEFVVAHGWRACWQTLIIGASFNVDATTLLQTGLRSGL